MENPKKRYRYLIDREDAIANLELRLLDCPNRTEKLINAGIYRSIDAIRETPIVTRVKKEEE